MSDIEKASAEALEAARQGEQFSMMLAAIAAMQQAQQLYALGSRPHAVHHDKGRAADNQLARAFASPRSAHFRVIDQLACLALDSIAMFDGRLGIFAGDIVDLCVTVRNRPGKP